MEPAGPGRSSVASREVAQQAVAPPPQQLSIRQEFEGSTIFITGVTGYLGSLVMEQALRCCPGVSQIFVLARGKRGVSAEERINRMIDTSPLFQRVREAGPHLKAKVVVVPGDLVLGLSAVGEPVQDPQDASGGRSANQSARSMTATAVETPRHLGPEVTAAVQRRLSNVPTSVSSPHGDSFGDPDSHESDDANGGGDGGAVAPEGAAASPKPKLNPKPNPKLILNP
ncbi:hypothetical protein FOA52_007188 [Chlamydomonas sp. UWO 241]|nr:hypothetical protein FOA52_007188 [Chlamydomonas sp. UWO 241]